MPIIRPHDYKYKVKLYKCASKAKTANSRFEDHVIKEDIYDVLLRYNFKCFFCNDKIKAAKWQLDHFNPKANGGKNTIDNLVPCCEWCNTMKNALDGFAFIHKCNYIVKYNNLHRFDMDAGFFDAKLNKKIEKKKTKLIEHINKESGQISDVTKIYIENMFEQMKDFKKQ